MRAAFDQTRMSSTRQSSTCGSAVLTIALLSAAFVSAAATPARIIGLGLSKLHWGMNPKEVQAAYPALEWQQAPQADMDLTGSYRALGCTFSITATFLGQPSPILKRIELETGDIGCSRDVQESLLQQFGTTPQKTSFLGVVSREWRLDPDYVEFAQYPDGWPGKAQRITITFADLTNAVYINQ